MKLIDIDSKVTLEDFLTLKKKTELIQFLRMSLCSDKDVETYLLKSRSDDNENMSCYRQFNRGFNFYKENYIHDIPFF
jgi:transcription elongation factor GreA-like protein